MNQLTGLHILNARKLKTTLKNQEIISFSSPDFYV